MKKQIIKRGLFGFPVGGDDERYLELQAFIV